MAGLCHWAAHEQDGPPNFEPTPPDRIRRSRSAHIMKPSFQETYMNIHRRLLPAILALFGWATVASGQGPELTEGVLVETDGKPVDARIGHLVPVTVDWEVSVVTL